MRLAARSAAQGRSERQLGPRVSTPQAVGPLVLPSLPPQLSISIRDVSCFGDLYDRFFRIQACGIAQSRAAFQIWLGIDAAKSHGRGTRAYFRAQMISAGSLGTKWREDETTCHRDEPSCGEDDSVAQIEKLSAGDVLRRPIGTRRLMSPGGSPLS